MCVGLKRLSPLRLPPHPMPLAFNLVPTARSVAEEIANRRRVAPLQPNSQRFCKPGRFTAPGATDAASIPLHTCERDSHQLSYYSSYIQQIAIGTQRAIMRGMKCAWLGCLMVGGLLFAGTQDSEFNVNSRYTVETVVVAGDGWRATVASPADREALEHREPALTNRKRTPPRSRRGGRRRRRRAPRRRCGTLVWGERGASVLARSRKHHRPRASGAPHAAARSNATRARTSRHRGFNLALCLAGC